MDTDGLQPVICDSIAVFPSNINYDRELVGDLKTYGYPPSESGNSMKVQQEKVPIPLTAFTIDTFQLSQHASCDPVEFQARITSSIERRLVFNIWRASLCAVT